MGVHRTCGEPDEIKKNTHPKYITALLRDQVPPGRDLIAQFAESCAGVGVKLGLYYSVTSNSYLNYPSLADPGAGQVRVVSRST